MADMPAGEALRFVRQQKAIRAEKRRREQARSQARLAETIEAARAGDPFPFIALQWGRILRADDVLSDPKTVHDLRAAGERFLLLDDFQHDILASLFDPSISEVYVKGNTGCGKGGAAGIAICTYYAIWSDARVVVSRDTSERAVKVVIGEVHRWWKRMLLPSPGCVLQTSGLVDLSDRTHEVRVVNPDSTEGFTGTHAEHVLVAFDEATASPLEPFYPLVPTIAHRFLAIANPRTTGGRFRRAFYECVDDDQVDKTQTVAGPNGQRRLITVDGDTILNVRAKCLKRPAGPPGGITVEGRRYEPGEPLAPEHAKATQALIPGQTCLDDHLAICAADDPDFVAWAGHGRFPQDDKELKVIRRRWLVEPGVAWRRFNEAWRRTEGRDGLRGLLRRWLPIRAFGLDVAGSEAGDASVLTAGGDRGVFRQFEGRYTDATALVDWVLRTAASECGVDLTQGGCPVGVDVVGLGWGVCGLLRSRGVRVIEIAGNAPSTVDAKTYANLRAEGYGELGRRLDMAGRWGYPEAGDGETEQQRRLRRRQSAPLVFLVPPDERLHEELRAVDKVYGTDGKKFAVTPKRKSSGMKPGTITIHDQIGRSPDRSDSLMYFHRALQGPAISLEEALEAGFF